MADQSPLLAAQVKVDGVPSNLNLTVDGTLEWTVVNGRERGGIAIGKEVLGIAVERYERTVVTIKTLKSIGGERRAGGFCCCLGSAGEGKVRRDVVLEMLEDDGADDLLVALAENIREVIDSLGRPRRLFVILNPFGGKKSAKNMFNNQVKPLLSAANIDYTLQETEYQLHAQELAYNLDLWKYDGIVCVSGDGVLSEVLNGLLRRDDWKSAIKMPLGIIPAGSFSGYPEPMPLCWVYFFDFIHAIIQTSVLVLQLFSFPNVIQLYKKYYLKHTISNAGTGNGMIKSILNPVCDDCTVTNAVFTVIQGYKCKLDIATVSQGETLFFSLLMLSWGLIADIDIESEKYRWMGNARLEIYPLIRIMNLRKYNGSIAFVPAPAYDTQGDPVNVDRWGELVSKNKETAQKNGYQGPKLSFQNSDWRMIKGPFVSVWLHNVPWSNNEVMAAPDAKFSDGYFDMTIVKDCPRASLLELLLKTKDGSYVKSPYVTYLKVKAIRLEPGEVVGRSEQGGIIDSDGEVLARGRGVYSSGCLADRMVYGPPIELQVEQSLATIFAPRYN